MPIETKPMLHKEHLEQLIDTYGLPRLLETLADVACEKAEHVQSNWQDRTLSLAWARCAERLGKLSNQLPRL